MSMYVMQRASAPARSIKTNGFIRGRKRLLKPGMMPHKLKGNKQKTWISQLQAVETGSEQGADPVGESFRRPPGAD